MAFPSQQTLRDTILPLAGVLEAIVSSKASKGQNISRTAFDAVDAMREREKEQDAARIAAIDRAAKTERDKTTLDILKETARQGRVKFEADDAERQFKENSKKAAVDRLLGIPSEYDEKTNTVTRSGVPGVSGLTDLDKAAIQADPLEWLANRMKPQSVSVIAADGGFYTLPKSGGVATPVQTEAGAPIKPPPKPAPSERPTQPPKGYRWKEDGTMEAIPGGPADPNAPKPLSAEDQNTIKMKLNNLKIAKSQIEAVKAANEEYKNGLFSGKWMGKAPTEAAERFEAAVAALKPTINAVTRVPGMGSMSDFETKLAMAPYPEPGKYNKTNDAAIAALEQLIRDTESGYASLSGPPSPAAALQAAFPPAKGAEAKLSPQQPSTQKDPRIEELKGLAKRGSQSAQNYLKSIGETW